MNSLFDQHAPDTFTAFSASHLAALGLFVLLTASLFASRGWLRHSKQAAKAVRYSLIAVLMLAELTLNIWYVAQNRYSVQDTLPLELCSLSLYMCVIMLLFKSRLLFQIAYFTGIGGALQALLTPALHYEFPHFRFVEFFAAHIAIILAVLYMAWVESCRPAWKSIGYTMLFLNAALLFIIPVNAVTGGNYMFVARKPDTASLIDWLGPYPWYLFSLEGVALVMFVLLYLPYAWSAYSRRKRHPAAQQHGS